MRSVRKDLKARRARREDLKIFTAAQLANQKLRSAAMAYCSAILNNFAGGGNAEKLQIEQAAKLAATAIAYAKTVKYKRG